MTSHSYKSSRKIWGTGRPSPTNDPTVELTPMPTRRTPAVAGTTVAVLMVLSGLSPGAQHAAFSAVHAQTAWRGLVIAPEQRCTPYAADEYRYPPSVEDRIIDELGGVYGPYTGRWFATQAETDIEHMVARSEAHDSGLCAADPETRRRFASDLLNLTLAGPNVNRYQKVDKDAAEWLPEQNHCWFAARVIAVRQKYELTIDQREADALDRVLAACASTALITVPRGSAPPVAAPADGHARDVTEWDDDRNGRVSCAEARAHGIAPVTRDHPAYPFMRDGDGDGVVCESGSAAPSSAAPASPPPAARGRAPYRNCTELRRDHPNGVARGHPAYQQRMDRNNDGRACER